MVRPLVDYATNYQMMMNYHLPNTKTWFPGPFGVHVTTQRSKRCRATSKDKRHAGRSVMILCCVASEQPANNTAHNATELTMASKQRGASRRKKSSANHTADHVKVALEELPPVDGYGPPATGFNSFDLDTSP